MHRDRDSDSKNLKKHRDMDRDRNRVNRNYKKHIKSDKILPYYDESLLSTLQWTVLQMEPPQFRKIRIILKITWTETVKIIRSARTWKGTIKII